MKTSKRGRSHTSLRNRVLIELPQIMNVELEIDFPIPLASQGSLELNPVDQELFLWPRPRQDAIRIEPQSKWVKLFLSPI